MGKEEGSNSTMGMEERREVGNYLAKGREEEKQDSGRRVSGLLKEPPQSMAR